MNNQEIFQMQKRHREMMTALQAGTATPEQQKHAFEFIGNLRKQHSEDMRDASRDARDAYHCGQSDAAAESRGEPYGTY